ncbi:hypothetical protein HMI55_000360 [Coelomomyces lativittatus]|nr:hypothetical protein HMI55_000360 [Coelomomyces lativittatus]
MLSNRYRVCLVLLTTFVFIQFLYRFYVRRAPVSFSGDSQNSLPSLQRVAIVGAGAAGCSFAKYLKEVFPSIQLDVFEKDTRVGGRVHSTVFDYPTFGIHEVVEWGASIFVDRNKNVLKAFEQFNLRNKEDPDEPYMTLYNGTHVVCTLPTDDSWTSTWIWFRRYNYNPYKLRRLADSVAVLLDPIYTSENDAYESYETLVNALGLKPYTAITSEEFLKPKFSEVFLKEIVEPVTLVNYANPLSAVHSLASLIGFVSGNWYSVKGMKVFHTGVCSVYFSTFFFFFFFFSSLSLSLFFLCRYLTIFLLCNLFSLKPDRFFYNPSTPCLNFSSDLKKL